uniref:Glycogen debranching enzyme bacterial and archaeal type N-terminal domain-containing protein n=1 Tax=Streptomyces sp. NBC_00049 TaxID=2903617 RepID=A0AAU2JZF6_9ACTN
MQTDAWLNQDGDFAPGRVLFRSDRTFKVWAYALSHSQLLLRSPGVDGGPRIDVLFKPVLAMRTGMDYEGLVIRCATTEEHARIVAEGGNSDHNRVHILESSDGRTDYVISGAVGWASDDEESGAPSSLAFFFGATDPARALPTGSP